MKIVFMGTPDFSVKALDALCEAGHDVCAVYSQPPRPAGRGKKLQKSAVHQRADILGLPMHTPTSMKGQDAVEAFAAHDADSAVVVAYGQILPQAILDAPRLGCFNIHASLLPRWRGAAPIHRAIMAGDEETGVCIMQMDAGLDTGPVFMREAVSITAEDTTGSLHDTLSEMGGRLMVETLKAIESSSLSATAQPEVGVTYAHKIDKAEALIDWSSSADKVDRHVRGLYPFPGAFTHIDGQRVKILAGHPVTDSKHGMEAGYAMNDGLLIGCGADAYQITKAQRAGKGAMDKETFLNGFSVPAGTKLG